MVNNVRTTNVTVSLTGGTSATGFSHLGEWCAQTATASTTARAITPLNRACHRQPDQRDGFL